MTTRAQLELIAVDRTRAAFDSVNRNLQSIGERVTNLGPAFGRLGALMTSGLGAASIGGVVAGLAALTKAQADVLDQFNDLKDATGASVENLSALDDVARRNGVTLDTVGGALVKFNNSLKEASDPNKGGGAVFKALGLDVEKLKALDPAEALRQTAVAFAGFADDGNKARAVQELFGKSVREMAPFLKDLAEQQQLNAKVTTEQAEEAEKFNKHLFAMQANLNDIGRSLAGPVIQGFNNFVAGVKDANKESESWLLTLLKLQPSMRLMLALMNRGPGSSGDVISDIATQRKALQDPTLSAGERASMQAKLSSLIARRNEAWAAEVTQADIGDAVSRRRAPSINVKEPGKKDTKLASMIEQGKDLADSLMAQEGGLASDFLEKWDKLSVAYKNNAISLEKLTEAQRQLLKQQPFMKREVFLGDIESDAMSRRLAAQERSRAGMEQLNRELDQLGDGGDSRKRALTAQLEARLNAGEQFDPATLDRIVRGIAGINQEFAETKDLSKEFGTAFTSALGDMLSGAKSLRDVLKGLATDILSIGLQKSITQPLGNKLGDWFSGAFAGMLPSFAGGGYTGGGSRSGGLDGMGGYLAMLHPHETVVDHARGQRAPGGVSHSYNIVVNATDNASKADLAKAVQFALAQAEARQRRSAVYGA